jgi:dimethylaniline monooxygenase (N-oxide forming)
MIMGLQDKSFNIPESWNLRPTTPFVYMLPIVAADEFVDGMRNAQIRPIAGIKEVTGPDSLVLTDGTAVSDIDTIVFCTGYKANLSMFDGSPYDPTRHTSARWTNAKGANGRPLPRLYQNIFSVDHPDSLAFTYQVGFQFPVFMVYDLASMALAQVWKGNSPLPPKDEMIRQTDVYHRHLSDLAQSGQGTISPDVVPIPDWYRWVNRTAGTGVYEHLGYGWTGWKFWLADRRFCTLLTWGLYSPHLYRIFEGPKRKAWVGAREAIEKANRERAQLVEPEKK